MDGQSAQRSAGIEYQVPLKPNREAYIQVKHHSSTFNGDIGFKDYTHNQDMTPEDIDQIIKWLEFHRNVLKWPDKKLDEEGQ